MKLKRQKNICECCPRYRVDIMGKSCGGKNVLFRELCRELDGTGSLILNDNQGEFIREDCNFKMEHLIINNG